MTPTITDWLMVGITLVYVVATIFICRANIKSAKATREQIEESRRQFEESNRALVTVSIDVIRGGLVTLKIQNTGKRVANHVAIRISPKFIENVKDLDAKRSIERLNNSEFMLGIEQCFYTCLGSHLQLKQLSAEILSIDITYSDSASSYSEHTAIDTSQYFWTLLYESPIEDIHKELKGMATSIQSINRSLQHLNT